MRDEEPTPRWFVAAMCLYVTILLTGVALIGWVTIEAVLWLRRH